ncbi:cardiolipin synthase [Paenibacillus glycanilyticus]|uniref:Cardiolipin synthase n=1 Tax=Paenibacillus glycanilyticus TaxID=126569 RepID=A0ABQ6G4Y2_9BACL|nr:cardiolipin synthase [Paenibacillus glycanilyticus]GLX66014.1 cardiolipin synthase [Paenibacillus glycanilyticus]
MIGWFIAIIVFLLLYSAQSVAIVWIERRLPAKATAWVFISLAVPVLGFACYWMIGRSRRVHAGRNISREYEQAAERLSICAESVGELGQTGMLQRDQLLGLLRVCSGRPVTLGNQVKVLTNGRETFASILEEMERASHHIHLDYYTIRDDEIGRKFLHVLTAKAKAGIEVRVLYDGIGSVHLSKRYVSELKQSGARVECFLPAGTALFKRLLNSRNHSKIAVIDGKVGFVGGINIGDEYLGKDKRLGFWRDTQLRLEGDAVYFLQELFMKDWELAAKERLPVNAGYMPEHDPDEALQEPVLIVSSGPDRSGEPILETAFASVTAATTSISISTPYFIPDESLLAALGSAAKSGVDVRLIIPGIADTQLVLWATLSFVERMLAAGVRVYRYQKGFIHAKVMIVDDLLAIVGTANMDMRSFHSNFEQNAVLFDHGTISRLKQDFEQDLLDSRELDLESFRQRQAKEKAAEAAARLLAPLL